MQSVCEFLAILQALALVDSSIKKTYYYYLTYYSIIIII